MQLDSERRGTKELMQEYERKKTEAEQAKRRLRDVRGAGEEAQRRLARAEEEERSLRQQMQEQVNRKSTV